MTVYLVRYLRILSNITDDCFIETEELRHTSHGITDSKELLIHVEPIIISISSSMTPVKASVDILREDISKYKGDCSLRLNAELEELEREYRKADDKQRRLKLEVKENEWSHEFQTLVSGLKSSLQ